MYQHINRIVDSCIDEYSDFMGIEYRPSYELQFKEISQARADIDGIESPANTRFLIDSQKHILWIATNLPVEKYIMFHEFTHMLDADMYINGSKVRKMGLGGYMEYHASQIEFAELLGAPKLKNINSFSMKDTCKTISGKKASWNMFEKSRKLLFPYLAEKTFLSILNDCLILSGSSLIIGDCDQFVKCIQQTLWKLSITVFLWSIFHQITFAQLID